MTQADQAYTEPLGDKTLRELRKLREEHARLRRLMDRAMQALERGNKAATRRAELGRDDDERRKPNDS